MISNPPISEWPTGLGRPAFYYVMAPYSDGSEKIIESRMQELYQYIFRRQEPSDYILFSPTVYAHTASKYLGLPTDAQAWEAYNLKWMAMADAAILYRLHGWEQSYGINHIEIPYFKEHLIPIFNVDLSV